MNRHDRIPVERIQTAERRREFVFYNAIVSVLLGQNHADIIHGYRDLGVVRVKKVSA